MESLPERGGWVLSGPREEDKPGFLLPVAARHAEEQFLKGICCFLSASLGEFPSERPCGDAFLFSFFLFFVL